MAYGWLVTRRVQIVCSEQAPNNEQRPIKAAGWWCRSAVQVQILGPEQGTRMAPRATKLATTSAKSTAAGSVLLSLLLLPLAQALPQPAESQNWLARWLSITVRQVFCNSPSSMSLVTMILNIDHQPYSAISGGKYLFSPKIII